jgi:hypothetical protein
MGLTGERLLSITMLRGEDGELKSDSPIRPRFLHAEADGNRTRLGALAPTPVLKTGGPTRCPDASASEDSGEAPKGTLLGHHHSSRVGNRRRTGSWAGRRPPIP